MRQHIAADGLVIEAPEPLTIDAIRALIGADTLGTVALRHMGHPLHVMLIDDMGHPKHLPVNEKATALYHANCRPGTTHPIRGDVFVCPDNDFASAAIILIGEHG